MTVGKVLQSKNEQGNRVPLRFRQFRKAKDSLRFQGKSCSILLQTVCVVQHLDRARQEEMGEILQALTSSSHDFLNY